MDDFMLLSDKPFGLSEHEGVAAVYNAPPPMPWRDEDRPILNRFDLEGDRVTRQRLAGLVYWSEVGVVPEGEFLTFSYHLYIEAPADRRLAYRIAVRIGYEAGGLAWIDALPGGGFRVRWSEYIPIRRCVSCRQKDRVVIKRHRCADCVSRF